MIVMDCLECGLLVPNEGEDTLSEGVKDLEGCHLPTL
jgi:hypothetical protein